MKRFQVIVLTPVLAAAGSSAPQARKVASGAILTSLTRLTALTCGKEEVRE